MTSGQCISIVSTLTQIILVSCLCIKVFSSAKNSKVAGIIASALYFPMLVFSGATLPYKVMPAAMHRVVDVLALTQGIKILKSATLELPIGNVLVPTIIMLVITLICTAVAIKFF